MIYFKESGLFPIFNIGAFDLKVSWDKPRQIFISVPLDSGAICSLELQHHGEEGRVDVPDAGEYKGDDGEAGHAPNHSHLHIQQPGGQVGPLGCPELFASIFLKIVTILCYLSFLCWVFCCDICHVTWTGKIWWFMIERLFIWYWEYFGWWLLKMYVELQIFSLKRSYIKRMINVARYLVSDSGQDHIICHLKPHTFSYQSSK